MKKLLAILIILYLSSVIFSPPFPASSIIRYDDLLLMLAFIVALVSGLKTKTKFDYEIIRKISVLVYALIIIMVTSALLSGFNGNYEYSGLFKELLRFAKYAMVVFVAISLKEHRYRRTVIISVIVLGLSVAAVQLLQYIGGVGFNSSLSAFYGDVRHFEPALAPSSRDYGYFYAGGPFANPNVAGSFLIIPFGLCIWYVLSDGGHRKDRRFSGKRRALWAVILLAFCGALLLTDSRASLAAALIAVAVAYFLSQRERNSSNYLAIAITLIAIAMMVLTQQKSTIRLFDEFWQGFSADGSLALKIQWLNDGLLEMFDKGAIWGLGAGEGPQVDFEYGYYLIWYGPLGLAAYLFLWIVIVRHVFTHSQEYEDWQALLAIAVAFMAMNLSQSTFLTVRVFPVFIIIFFMHVNWGLLVKSGAEQERNPLIRVAPTSHQS